MSNLPVLYVERLPAERQVKALRVIGERLGSNVRWNAYAALLGVVVSALLLGLLTAGSAVLLMGGL